MPLKAQIVKQSSAVRADHVERQVAPMHVSLWALIDMLCWASNELVRGIFLFWHIIISGVMRPAHVQRTRFTDMAGGALHAITCLGKSRQFGRRRPFSWRLPDVSITGRNMGRQTLDFFRKVGSAKRYYFLPDVKTGSSALDAKHWMTSPMPLDKIKKLTVMILDKIQVPREIQSQLSGFYSGRRLLPTIAHRCKLSTSERLDVGGWSSPGSQALSMPQRYSEAKLDMQSLVRKELLQIAGTALHSIIKSNPLPSLKDEKGMSLSDTWHLWPMREKEKQIPSPNDVALWLASMFPNVGKISFSNLDPSILPQKRQLAGLQSKPHSDSESDSSSETSCMAEAIGSDVGWQLSLGKKGCLHLRIGDGLACGRTLNRPETGVGLDLAMQSGRDWSPRCKAALLDSEIKWWDDSHKV